MNKRTIVPKQLMSDFYLIGVLHVIEEALVRCIEDETNEEEGD